MSQFGQLLAADKTLKEGVQVFAARQALGYLDKDPEANMPKLLNWVEAFDRQGILAPHTRAVRKALDRPEGNWYQLIKSLWADIDEKVRTCLKPIGHHFSWNIRKASPSTIIIFVRVPYSTTRMHW